ncbi:hypothetical protein QCA50_009379 [Cerrena zonata]|uniref:Uncharacterized protein n=1 Tax=Cerrena zonata TaxID=2478898 RepID=A0AAW0G536_9APHY
MDYLTHLDKKDPSKATRQLPGLGYTYPVKYWDFHVYYESDTKEESDKLREKLLIDFEQEGKEGLIIVKKLPKDVAIGPHYTPFWEVDVTRVEIFAKLISWFLLNHGTLSVLIHPQTGDDLRDHTNAALWLGKRLELKTHIFSPTPAGIAEFGVKGGAHIKPEDFDTWVTKFD